MSAQHSTRKEEAHQLIGVLFFAFYVLMACAGLGATALVCVLYIESWKVALASIGLEILMIAWPGYKTFAYFYWKIVSVK